MNRRQAPPDAPPPGDKPREYPHSSGDRNTFPLERHPHKEDFSGGRQRVAPTDVPRRHQQGSGDATAPGATDTQEAGEC